ncbi:MAG TPA: zinc ribbon domain-containing protein [Pyrinomonadaceae bacterium]|nr:zinc ribbon domain-containing protein [Pyrinomonadaceae bacterium]
MFCPKCSRPLADDVQFCQQCGLALGVVRRVLEGGEGEAEAAAAGGKARALSPRRRGYRQGFKLVLLALLLLPLYPLVEGLLESLIPSVENTRLDELPLELFGTALFVAFVGGLLRMLYARMFESGGAPAEIEGEGEAGPRMFGAFGSRALPPTQSVHVEDFTARRVNTADLAKARSVTEHTTRSLRID